MCLNYRNICSKWTWNLFDSLCKFSLFKSPHVFLFLAFSLIVSEWVAIVCDCVAYKGKRRFLMQLLKSSKNIQKTYLAQHWLISVRLLAVSVISGRDKDFQPKQPYLPHAALYQAGEVIWIPMYSHGCLMEEWSFVCFSAWYREWFSVTVCCHLHQCKISESFCLPAFRWALSQGTGQGRSIAKIARVLPPGFCPHQEAQSPLLPAGCGLQVSALLSSHLVKGSAAPGRFSVYTSRHKKTSTK